MNEKNRVCDANSGLINRAGGVVIDTQSDLAHTCMASGWRAVARLYMNLERAYREFRHEPPDAPWDQAATFDASYQVAKAREIEAEF